MKDSSIDDLTENLRKVLADAEGLLAAGVGAAGEQLGDRAHSLDQTVRAHPWQALAVTGVIGFLLGLLVRRR